jgi:tetratricopeptide (TPR) repeat protein
MAQSNKSSLFNPSETKGESDKGRKSVWAVFTKIFPVTILICASAHSSAFCQSLLQNEAFLYRQKGYDAQQAGLLGEALSFYQKAIQIDPAFAPVYNDLGVVYETLGQPDTAEQAYLKCISIDPGHVMAYYNLAQVYEGRGDFLGAAQQWQQLVSYGSEDDPMVKKAQDRIFEIGNIYPEVRKKYMEEQVSILTKRVIEFQQRIALDNKALAQHHIERARNHVKRRDYLRALRIYLNVKQIDPQNDQIDALIEETQRKLLLH